MKNSKEMHVLIKKRGTNQLDDLTLGLVMSLFRQWLKEYPESEK